MPKKTQRKTQRIETSAVVRFTCSGDSFFGQILNLSQNGICIAAETLPEAGSAITAFFTLPETENPMGIKGKVIWKRSDQTGEGSPAMGVEFTEIPEKDKITLLRYVAGSQMTLKGY